MSTDNTDYTDFFVFFRVLRVFRGSFPWYILIMRIPNQNFCHREHRGHRALPTHLLTQLTSLTFFHIRAYFILILW